MGNWNIEGLKREARIKNQYIEGLIEVIEYVNNRIEYCEVVDYDENGDIIRNKNGEAIKHAPTEEDNYYDYYRYVAYKEVCSKLNALLEKELK